jgi:hypothetical protein
LLIQEDKTDINHLNPELQLIAEAIRVFQKNNQSHASMDLPTLNMMTILAIMMVGTWLMFFLVLVTQQLSNGISSGNFPGHKTVMRNFSPHCMARNGMVEIDGVKDLNQKFVQLQFALVIY